MSRITTVALEMLLPGLVGYWFDRRWNTNFLAIVGFVIGLIGGFWHLLLITGAIGRAKKKSPPLPRDKDAP